MSEFTSDRRRFLGQAGAVAAGAAASATLTDYNCQLQAQLGIAACTSSTDEE